MIIESKPIASTGISTVIMFCGSALNSYNEQIIKENINLVAPVNASGYDFETDKFNPPRYLSKVDSEEEVILCFASKILNNLQEMPPEFSRAVDEHFWDLF